MDLFVKAPFQTNITHQLAHLPSSLVKEKNHLNVPFHKSKWMS